MILQTLANYWANNATLTAALPISKVFLDWIPPSVALPYARLSVIASVPDYNVGPTHIEHFDFQISVFGTDLDGVMSITDAVQSQFDQAHLTIPTLICMRTNRGVTGEVLDGNYTYHAFLEYDWSYNSSLS